MKIAFGIKIFISFVLILASFILLNTNLIGFKGIISIILIALSIYFGRTYEKNKHRKVEEAGKPAPTKNQ